jgi:cytochrome b6-f complex iron-sulfur subunit
MGSYNHIRLTRRKMIRALGWLSLIPMAGLWGYMVKREQFRDERRLSRIRLSDIPQGNSFYNEYWIKRSSDSFKVFSTRCTHLGCRIRPADGDQMVCPCHGSAYDAENGSVIKGPAEKPLEMLNFNIVNDYLTIYIK